MHQRGTGRTAAGLEGCQAAVQATACMGVRLVVHTVNVGNFVYRQWHSYTEAHKSNEEAQNVTTTLPTFGLIFDQSCSDPRFES